MTTGALRPRHGGRGAVLAHLARAGEIVDERGRANATLRDAVSYPGSGVAFAQLLAGMERAGLIEREVRGKRTYRVALTGAGKELAGSSPESPEEELSSPLEAESLLPEHSAEPRTTAGTKRPAEGAAEGPELDYEELAAAVIRLAARSLQGDAEAPRPEVASGGTARAERRIRSMERSLANLEKDLARTRGERSELAERNAELLGLLEAAERNADILRQELDKGRSRTSVRARLDDDEASLLRRLVGSSDSSRADGRRGRRGR